MTEQHQGSGNTKQTERSGITIFNIALGNAGMFCPLGNSDGSINQNSESSLNGSKELRPTAVSSAIASPCMANVALTTENTTPVARHVYKHPSVEALLHLAKCPAASDEEIFVMAYAVLR